MTSKRLISVMLILSIIFCFTGCDAIKDVFYPPDRPIDFNTPSKWVSSDPYICFVISDEEMAAKAEGFGQIIFNGKTTDVFVSFSAYSNFQIFSSDDRTLLYDGDCKYKGEEFTVNTEKDMFFNGKYEKITFNKVDCEEESF